MGIPIPLGSPSGSSATAGDVLEDEEVPSEQNEGANPINHQPVQQGETSHETGPIVVASPETLPYNGPAASSVPIPTKPAAASPEEKVTVAVTGSSHSPGSGIVIQGYLENGEGYRRQGLVQIDQDSESPLMTFETDPTGSFVVLIDEFDSTTAFVDGTERIVARFFLLPLWMGPEYRPLGEETVIEVSLEGIYFVDEKKGEAAASPAEPVMLWKVETLAEQPEEAHKVYVLPVLKPVHKPFLTLVPLTPKKPHIAEMKTPLLIPNPFLLLDEEEGHPLPAIKPLWFEGVD